MQTTTSETTLPHDLKNFKFTTCDGRWMWVRRGQLIGLGLTRGGFSTREAAVENAVNFEAGRFNTRPSRYIDAIADLLSSARKVRPETMATLERLLKDPRTSLRYAAAYGSSCGPGTARHMLFSLSRLGRHSLEAESLAKTWRAAHESIDRLSAWADWTECDSIVRDACDAADVEDWRRATIDAFDGEIAPGLKMEDRAAAWACVAARWYALHLLGVTVSEVPRLRAHVRGWMPARFRRTHWVAPDIFVG